MIAVWDELDGGLLDGAARCAEGVIEGIREKVFWPPAKDVPERYDEFGALFFGGPEESVDAGHLAAILSGGGGR